MDMGGVAAEKVTPEADSTVVELERLPQWYRAPERTRPSVPPGSLKARKQIRHLTPLPSHSLMKGKTRNR